MRDSRQLTVLRSLFRTLHPALTSTLKNGLEPAKRMFNGAYQRSTANKEKETETENAEVRADEHADTADAKRAELPPLPRSLTDEYLVTELEKATSQFDLQRSGRSSAGQTQAGQTDSAHSSSRKPGKPARGRKHFSRDSLLSLLEEAKVRIQVLETELELARGSEQNIPLLTEEWSDDLPSTHSRKPD